MMRTPTLFISSLLTAPLLALSGGPDQYGYTWKDSNEPGGPSFNWVDITTIGTQVMGLADDNVMGPFVMQTDMPFYWYEAKKVWIGSNGYLAFNNVNVASPFPNIPMAGAPNDYVAALTSDLNFLGLNNPAECWFYDDPSLTIVSYIDVPFWTNIAPNWTGQNTFQVILNKTDSTITIQYQTQNGLAFLTDLVVGIESLTGDIGLQHSADVYPVGGYAVRFYAPVVPLITVTDASVEWTGDETSAGVSLKRNGPDHPLTINVRNTGNVGIGNFNAQCQVFNGVGALVMSDNWPVDSLAPGIDTTITFPSALSLSQQGTYRVQGGITGIVGEIVVSNNVRDQELVVYDTTFTPQTIKWAGSQDDLVGIGWDGGDGGVATYVIPAAYPAYTTGYALRIASNTTPSPFTLALFDDDGIDGAPGTMIDSIFIPAAQGTAGDHIFPLTAPLTITDGGVYVRWYMEGPFVNIAQDIQPPFSLRSYEVLSGVWAEYRDRDVADLHLGIQITAIPVYDVGCTGFFGLIPGLDVNTPVNVRTWVKNFGNQTMNNFPVNYRFDGEPVVTETYPGPALPPGDSVLYTFNTLFTPSQNLTADLCTWTSYASDASSANDTACVNIDAMVGIDERTGHVLMLTPNPANDRVTISGLPKGEVDLGLFDIAGALVKRVHERVTDDQLLLPLNDLAQGTYTLQVIAGEHSFTGKVIVQR